MHIVNVETFATGSRVELKSDHRIYMACVMPDGRIIAVDVYGGETKDGSWWRCNRFRSKRFPRRITDAVRLALAH